jgi:hypothetical protein
MKAFDDPHHALADGLASSFSLTEKLACKAGQAFRLSRIESHDEHSRADILTSGLEPCSRLPGLAGQWLWEFVARYSGVTVPDSHGVP